MNSHGVSFGEALRVWVRVALLSFGGPAGQIAVMHRILVDEKRWVSEPRFLHALNYCMLLPGPEAQQLATYIGWLLHGWRGGLVAGGLFILPGFLSILALSLLYARFSHTTLVEALFFGLKAAVLAVVFTAVARLGRRAIRNRAMLAVAAAAFVAIFLFDVPFPWIVASAALLGFVGVRLWPNVFAVNARPDADADGGAALNDEYEPDRARPTARRALLVVSIWLPLWLVPVALLAAWLGREHVLVTQAVFFSKASVVTFGGAYAVLAYVAQQAVEVYHWLAPGEMLNGLGLAETTPGPLIQVVQFVGFMGTLRQPEPFAPVLAGVLGSVVVTWVTFTPCFLWVFLGAPYVERARKNRALAAALGTITSAVLGVILNLAVWFALHVAFARVEEWHAYGLRLLVPDWRTASPATLVITLAAYLAMARLKWGLGSTLAAATAAGALWRAAGSALAG